MKKNFKIGDLVITNNFTLKQDIYLVKNGEMRNIGRYTRDKLFFVLSSYIKSEKIYNTGVKIYIPKNLLIPSDFEYKDMIENY